MYVDMSGAGVVLERVQRELRRHWVDGHNVLQTSINLARSIRIWPQRS